MYILFIDYVNLMENLLNYVRLKEFDKKPWFKGWYDLFSFLFDFNHNKFYEIKLKFSIWWALLLDFFFQISYTHTMIHYILFIYFVTISM